MQPPLLDPFPAFHHAPLDFPLDSLNSLASHQLALVQFHPDATREHCIRAELLFKKRRRLERDEEAYRVGLKDAELRQVERARQWLEGTLPQSRPMRDAAVQTQAPDRVAAPDQVGAGMGGGQVNAGQQRESAPQSTLPAASLPLDPTAPPGPSFSFPDTTEPCPRELSSHFHILWCGDLDDDVTPLLFLHFPRPLAIRRSSSGAMMLAFRSAAYALHAQQRLDGEPLPLMRCKIRAIVRGNSGSEFRWRDLSDEVRDAWDRMRALPPAEGAWVEKAPGPVRGVRVSAGYQREWERIEAVREARRRDEEEEQAVRRAASLREKRKWREANWGVDYDGHESDCESCPDVGEFEYDDVYIRDLAAKVRYWNDWYSRVEFDRNAWIHRQAIQSIGYADLNANADWFPWYRPPPPREPTPPSPTPSPTPPPPAPAPQPNPHASHFAPPAPHPQAAPRMPHSSIGRPHPSASAAARPAGLPARPPVAGLPARPAFSQPRRMPALAYGYDPDDEGLPAVLREEGWAEASRKRPRY
ncbi:hypothetical protein JCM10449v2_000656 [Rhodotorula kratochvilovae]